MMGRVWVMVGVLAMLAACAKSPERRQVTTEEPSEPGPVATAPALPPGELPTEPPPGGRTPPPPMPGERAPLPPPTPDDIMEPGTPEAPADPGEAPGVAEGATPEQTPEETVEVPGLDQAPPASPPPDTAPAEPELFPGGEVTLRRFVLCKGVEDREPVDPSGTFRRERDGKIWAYLDAANSAEDPRDVTITFEAVDRPGAAAPPVELEIGPGPRWRTWAWATAWRAPGRYRVVVRDGSGNVLARAPFEVVE